MSPSQAVSIRKPQPCCFSQKLLLLSFVQVGWRSNPSSPDGSEALSQATNISVITARGNMRYFVFIVRFSLGWSVSPCSELTVARLVCDIVLIFRISTLQGMFLLFFSLFSFLWAYFFLFFHLITVLQKLQNHRQEGGVNKVQSDYWGKQQTLPTQGLTVCCRVDGAVIGIVTYTTTME